LYLVELYCKEIREKNKTMEDVPIGLKSKVQEELDKDVKDDE